MAEEGSSKFRLPDLEEQTFWGVKLADRAVGMVLGTMLLLMVTAVLSLLFVRLDITVECWGALEPNPIRRVHSPVAALVDEVLVSSGEQVAEGQVLAMLDAHPFEQRLERLRLESRLGEASPSMSRDERELLALSIREAEAELERRRIRSTGTGIVLTEDLELLPGNWVEEGDLLLEVGGTDGWLGRLTVAERDIHLVQVGDRVKVDIPALESVDSWITASLPATVRFVGADLVNQQAGTSAYRVIIHFEDEQIAPQQRDRFKRGMSLNGRIITRSGTAIDLMIYYFRRRLGVAWEQPA